MIGLDVLSGERRPLACIVRRPAERRYVSLCFANDLSLIFPESRRKLQASVLRSPNSNSAPL